MFPHLVSLINLEFERAAKENRFRDVVYHINMCHVCQKYGKRVNLKRCSNCKMIAYCSREHQKEHWPNHKQFCQLIGKMNKESGCSIFDWKNQIDPNKESWEQFKRDLLCSLQLKMGRTFTPCEMTMIISPRSCFVCHEIDSQKLVDCPNCPNTTFCTEHANQKDHKKRCENSVLSFQLRMESYKELHLSPSVDIGAEVPKDMEGVIRIYKTAYNIDETKLSSKLGIIQFTNVLTWPYTILYALKKLSFSKSHINLHIVGAEDKEEKKSIDHWEVLFHYIKPLRHLEITLIGPNLETEDTTSIKLCKICKAKKAKMLIRSIPKLYHDYANSKKFTKPDIIAGFNLGIHETPVIGGQVKDTWPQTIKEIEKQGCPFIMTSYTLREHKEDQKMIDDILNRNVKFVCAEKNSFPSFEPVSDFDNEFFFCNNYLVVYERL